MKIKRFNKNKLNLPKEIKEIYESFKDFLSTYDLSDIPLSDNIYQNYQFYFKPGSTTYEITYSEVDHNDNNLGQLKVFYDLDEDGFADDFFNSKFLCGIKRDDGIESISKIQDSIYKIEIGINTPPYKGSNDCKVIQMEIEKWINHNFPFMEIRKSGGYLFFSFTPKDLDF